MRNICRTPVPSRFAIAALLGSVLLTGSLPVKAQSDDSQPIWSLRGIAGLPSDTRIAFAEASEPIWYQVETSPDMTIGEILEEVCGDQPATAQDYLASAVLTLNGAQQLDERVPKDHAIAVPFCLKVERDVGVQVQPNDYAEKILKREYGVSGPKTVQQFFALNAHLPGLQEFSDFENRMPIGIDLTVPYAAPERLFVQRSTAEVAAPDIIATIPDGTLRSLIRENLSSRPEARPQEPYQFNVVQTVRPDGNGNTDCRGDAGQIADIVAPTALAARFAAEAERLMERAGRAPSTSLIGLIDTGLSRVDDDFFERRFFEINVSELTGGSGIGRDDDGNGHVDDIFGTDFFTKNGDILPVMGRRETGHGTMMASLALGGPRLAPGWPASLSAPPAKLKIVNFSSQHPRRALVDASHMHEAIDYLASWGTDILNISMASSVTQHSVAKKISSNDAILFVVAAGNAEIGEGADLATFSLFPARYGGNRLNRHVVTVGAHDHSGQLARFSHYSNEFVDLLAPGCAVEARDHTGQIVLDYGTSPATAIVSFTASLVRALGIQKAHEVKNRLLVGTDFDPILAAQAWSSGRLNILKTISLYHDVIETTDERAPVNGHLAALDQIMGFCRTPPRLLDPRSLRKVIPNIRGRDGLEMEYWFEVDHVLSQRRCLQSDSTASIGTITTPDGDIDGPPVSEIREIVPAFFRQR